MVRKILNDEQWARIAPQALPGKKRDPGKSWHGQSAVRGGGAVGGAHGVIKWVDLI